MLCERARPKTEYSFLLGTEQRFDAGDVCTLDEQRVADATHYMAFGAEQNVRQRNPKLITTTINRSDTEFHCTTIVDVTDAALFQTQLTESSPAICDTEKRSFHRGLESSPTIVETRVQRGASMPDLALHQLYGSADDDERMPELRVVSDQDGLRVRMTGLNDGKRDGYKVLDHLASQGHELSLTNELAPDHRVLHLVDGKWTSERPGS